jgi:hypothetical protein
MLKYNDIFLNKMRITADPLADNLVAILFEKGYNVLIEADYNNFKNNNAPFPVSFPQELKEYFDHIRQEPTTLEKKNVDQGSKFFVANAQVLMATLGLLSLPYCYAAADGAQVLAFSQRINSNPEKRLLETSGFVLDVCQPDAFASNGSGFISIAKVRLMHAAIRYHLLKSGKWDMNYGHPINQEDMAGTNLAFSLIAIRGLRKLGFVISHSDASAYVAMWNYIGRLGGVNSELLPDNAKLAFLLEKRIADRNFRPSAAGQELTKSLTDYMKKSAAAANSKIPAEELMGYLLGPEIAKMLNVKYSNLNSTIFSSAKGLVGLRSAFLAPKNELKDVMMLLKQQGVEQTLMPFRLLNNLRD